MADGYDYFRGFKRKPAPSLEGFTQDVNQKRMMENQGNPFGPLGVPGLKVPDITKPAETPTPSPTPAPSNFTGAPVPKFDQEGLGAESFIKGQSNAQVGEFAGMLANAIRPDSIGGRIGAYWAGKAQKFMDERDDPIRRIANERANMISGLPSHLKALVLGGIGYEYWPPEQQQEYRDAIAKTAKATAVATSSGNVEGAYGATMATPEGQAESKANIAEAGVRESNANMYAGAPERERMKKLFPGIEPTSDEVQRAAEREKSFKDLSMTDSEKKRGDLVNEKLEAEIEALRAKDPEGYERMKASLTPIWDARKAANVRMSGGFAVPPDVQKAKFDSYVSSAESWFHNTLQNKPTAPEIWQTFQTLQTDMLYEVLNEKKQYSNKQIWRTDPSSLKQTIRRLDAMLTRAAQTASAWRAQGRDDIADSILAHAQEQGVMTNEYLYEHTGRASGDMTDEKGNTIKGWLSETPAVAEKPKKKNWWSNLFDFSNRNLGGGE